MLHLEALFLESRRELTSYDYRYDADENATSSVPAVAIAPTTEPPTQPDAGNAVGALKTEAESEYVPTDHFDAGNYQQQNGTSGHQANGGGRWDDGIKNDFSDVDHESHGTGIKEDG